MSHAEEPKVAATLRQAAASVNRMGPLTIASHLNGAAHVITVMAAEIATLKQQAAQPSVVQGMQGEVSAQRIREIAKDFWSHGYESGEDHFDVEGFSVALLAEVRKP